MRGRDLTKCPRVLREWHEALRRAACTTGNTKMDTHWARLNTPMKRSARWACFFSLSLRSVRKAVQGRVERDGEGERGGAGEDGEAGEGWAC